METLSSLKLILVAGAALQLSVPDAFPSPLMLVSGSACTTFFQTFASSHALVLFTLLLLLPGMAFFCVEVIPDLYLKKSLSAQIILPP